MSSDLSNLFRALGPPLCSNQNHGRCGTGGASCGALYLEQNAVGVEWFVRSTLEAQCREIYANLESQCAVYGSKIDNLRG